MGNEMGNRNVSGMQEESTAVEAPEKTSQEAAPTNEMKGENHIIPEAEGKDFHKKIAVLSSDEHSCTRLPQVENQKSGGREEAETELNPPPQSSEDPIESHDAASQDSEIQRASSPKDDGNHEKSQGSNLLNNMLGISDQQIWEELIIGAEKVETSSSNCNSESASLDVDPKSDQHVRVANHTEPPAIDHSESPLSSEKTLGSSISCFSEENVQLLDTEDAQNLAVSEFFDTKLFNVEKKEDDLSAEKTASQQEKLVETRICEEKSEISCGGDLSKITLSPTFFDGLGNNCNVQLPPEINFRTDDSSNSFSEAVPQASSLDPFQEVSEAQEKCVVLIEDAKLMRNGSEIGGNKGKTDQTQFSDWAANEFMTEEANSSQSETIMIGYDCKKNEKETLVVSNSPVINKVHQIEEVKVTDNGDKSGLDDTILNPVSEELGKDSEEVTERMPEIGTGPTELTVTSDSHEEERPTEKEKNSCSIGGETEHCMQGQGLLSPSPASPFKPQYQKEDTLVVCEAAENRTALVADLNQQDFSELFLNKVLIDDAKNATKPTLVSTTEMENSKPRKELAQNVQKTLVKINETETPAMQSNEQCAKGEKSAFSCSSFEVREIMGRLSTEANPENQRNQVELRKSPSFHFDLSLGTRSEESDRTPLLHNDKTATRSSSSRIEMRSQIPTAQTGYARDLIQYKTVEEKTIRMERSDSENSRGSFLSLLKKEERTNVVVTVQEKESCVSDKQEVNELALTSQKGSGKRKPRASLFSTCICCAAAIH
ncbi:unnamed protein product [Ilex paraguariensis]|uniref:Uncharacterized protein n=1 Tax=Ilex paraguariensis TaxID=185542 RepID=A0ABC8SUF1_9AQUA